MTAIIYNFPISNRYVSIEPLSAIDLAKALSKGADNAAKRGVERQKELRQSYYDRLGINIALKALWPQTTRGRNEDN